MALCLAAFHSTPSVYSCSPAPSFRTSSFSSILLPRFPFSCGHWLANSHVSPRCYSSGPPSPAVPVRFKMTSERQPTTLSPPSITITWMIVPLLSLLGGVRQSEASARRRRPAFATSRAALRVALLFSIAAMPAVLGVVSGCDGSLSTADPSACLMNGATDGNCCATVGEGACTSGFAFEQGAQKCGLPNGNGSFKSTCCIPSASVGPTTSSPTTPVPTTSSSDVVSRCGPLFDGAVCGGNGKRPMPRWARYSLDEC